MLSYYKRAVLNRQEERDQLQRINELAIVPQNTSPFSLLTISRSNCKDGSYTCDPTVEDKLCIRGVSMIRLGHHDYQTAQDLAKQVCLHYHIAVVTHVYITKCML